MNRSPMIESKLAIDDQHKFLYTRDKIQRNLKIYGNISVTEM